MIIFKEQKEMISNLTTQTQEEIYEIFYNHLLNQIRNGKIELDSNLYLGTLNNSGDVILIRGDLLPISSEMIIESLESL